MDDAYSVAAFRQRVKERFESRADIMAAVGGDHALNPDFGPSIEDREFRDAAVLIPVIDRGGDAHILLTQRTEHLNSHSGQVAFPGGKIDAGESAQEAALREAHEEVGLKSGDIDKATEILDQVPADRANEPAVEAARTALELATAAPADDAVTARLRETVKATPTDLQARYDLAEALLAGGDQAGAADQLLAITALDREWNEQAARTLLLKIFEAAGPMSDVARDGRRRLSSILFA